ncbi:MAG: hypothetical protein ACOVOQ_07330 [Flavobacterium sp.]
MENNFCIIIISNGRPNDIITLKTLKKAGCNLPIYILIDNQDKTQNEYLDKYKEMVHIFDKDKYGKMVDNYDNFNNYRSTTHARNACFDLSKELGYEYFLVLDDDYTEFKMRINHNLEHPNGKYLIIKNIDNVFLKTLEYYKNSNFTSICYSQGGDWFGGETNFNKKPKRKAMNSWFCSINRPFKFISRLNEDVNTYMALGHQGYVFMTIPFIQLDQKQTQKTKGGMTDAYLLGGTYVKSFYTILNRPDCTEINLMGRTDKRLHHLISWKNAVPVIIDEKYKK